MRPIRNIIPDLKHPRITKIIDRDTFERIRAIFYLIKINIKAGLRDEIPTTLIMHHILENETTKRNNRP